jgi:ABC-type iron transport system FetAB ATPase subunit
MSVYLDIYMGNKDEHAREEAAYSRTVSYCKQETPNLFGAAVTPEVSLS